jgi:type I restriction enzyme S subunit
LHDNEINNARANLSLGFFRSLTIPIPKLSDQERLISFFDALSEETKALEAIYERKQSALAELKQSLLKKAFSGEL